MGVALGLFAAVRALSALLGREVAATLDAVAEAAQATEERADDERGSPKKRKLAAADAEQRNQSARRSRGQNVREC